LEMTRAAATSTPMVAAVWSKEGLINEIEQLLEIDPVAKRQCSNTYARVWSKIPGGRPLSRILAADFWRESFTCTNIASHHWVCVPLQESGARFLERHTALSRHRAPASDTSTGFLRSDSLGARSPRNYMAPHPWRRHSLSRSLAP
jgi:hypothetical protein